MQGGGLEVFDDDKGLYDTHDPEPDAYTTSCVVFSAGIVCPLTTRALCIQCDSYICRGSRAFGLFPP